MAEALNVRVVSTGEERTIEDVVPTEAAELFWDTTDFIGAQRRSWRMRGATMQPTEAHAAFNDVLLGIDERLVVSGIGKTLELQPFSGYDAIELTPEVLKQPSTVYLMSYDMGISWRHATIDGKREQVQFTDDHIDRYRELSLEFEFQPGLRDGKRLDDFVLKYSIPRVQGNQDKSASISMLCWHIACMDPGYAGHPLQRVALNNEQELQVLESFRAICGIAVEASLD